MDVRCLLRAIDAVPARKSPKQAWIFSVSPTITLSGLCIHRKAINKDKPTHPLAYCPPGSKVSSVGLSWHTSFVGVPGYSWYCLPGSRVLCVASCPVRIVLEDCHMQGKMVYSCLSPWRGWLPSEGRWWYAFGLGVKSLLL